MRKQSEDPLVSEIRIALMPGRFACWNEVSDLVYKLDRVQKRVDALVKLGEAKRAVELYEIFLSGIYAKIEEADDECDLANLFHRLICGWIDARQAAGRCAKETVSRFQQWAYFNERENVCCVSMALTKESGNDGKPRLRGAQGA